jgi:hypothetical protein
MDGAPSIDYFPTSTLGGQLERHRFEDRARRLGLVIEVLRERASASSRSGPIPSGLRQAITDFSAEISQVRRRSSSEHAEDEAAGAKSTRSVDQRRTRVTPSSTFARR